MVRYGVEPFGSLGPSGSLSGASPCRVLPLYALSRASRASWERGAVHRRYPVDPARQALLGYSDGASYALSVGLSNPRVFSAVMGWAAGFKLVDESAIAAGDPKPRVLLEYGSHDPLFPFQHIALPMKADLEARGYVLEFRVDQGGKHWPSGEFQGEALDWFFGGPSS